MTRPQCTNPETPEIVPQRYQPVPESFSEDQSRPPVKIVRKLRSPSFRAQQIRDAAQIR